MAGKAIKRREPMQQIPGRGPHAFEISGPDRDREQHHVARREARYGHGPEEFGLGAPVAAFQLLANEGDRREAQALDCRDQGLGQAAARRPRSRSGAGC